MGRGADDMRKLMILTLLGLAACGPVTVQQAERQCLDRALLAAHPRGEASLGMASGGHVGAGLSVTISSDYITGRDPSAVYDACVYQKSGQPPSRPLYSLPEWRG